MSTSAISGFTGAPVAGAADAQPPPWKTWHSDSDIEQRRALIHEMCVARRLSGGPSAQRRLLARCFCSRAYICRARLRARSAV